MISHRFLFLFQIASHSKSSTRSRFWNRSFHILSCNDHSMKSSVRSEHSCRARTSIALDNSNISENSSSRLDRMRWSPLEDYFSWRRCNWQQSFLVSVIILLLNMTLIECLQARQEGRFMCTEQSLTAYELRKKGEKMYKICAVRKHNFLHLI